MTQMSENADSLNTALDNLLNSRQFGISCRFAEFKVAWLSDKGLRTGPHTFYLFRTDTLFGIISVELTVFISKLVVPIYYYLPIDSLSAMNGCFSIMSSQKTN